MGQSCICRGQGFVANVPNSPDSTQIIMGQRERVRDASHLKPRFTATRRLEHEKRRATPLRDQNDAALVHLLGEKAASETS